MPAKNLKPLPRTTGRRVVRPSLGRRLTGTTIAILRLIGTPIAARPVMSSGIAGVVVLLVVVSGNAFYAQPGRHPKPMMATRSGSPGEAAVTASDLAEDGGLMPVPLVLEVQNALAQTGHYTAALDGKPGRATAAAIRAFQAEHALRVDGEPSPLLLRQIQQRLAAAPIPSDPPAEAERYASIDDRFGTSTQSDAEAAGGEKAAASDPTATGSTGSAAGADLVRRIQAGLRKAEVAELTADGIPGEQTRAAIRTFEALEGLDVTGKPDERILERLIAIGAAE